MRLIVRHPQVAFRDCAHCLKYDYDEETGEPQKWRGGDLERPAEFPAPCRTKRGCPKGTPENPKTLSRRNWQAYEHWRRCKAVGRFPDCEIVAKNAEIIESIVAHQEKLDQLRTRR